MKFRESQSAIQMTIFNTANYAHIWQLIRLPPTPNFAHCSSQSFWLNNPLCDKHGIFHNLRFHSHVWERNTLKSIVLHAFSYHHTPLLGIVAYYCRQLWRSAETLFAVCVCERKYFNVRRKKITFRLNIQFFLCWKGEIRSAVPINLRKKTPSLQRLFI